MGMIQYSNIGDCRQTPNVKHYLLEEAEKKISRRKAELSEVEQILLEVKLIDYLQNEVDRCNLHLKNFKLRLIMEED